MIVLDSSVILANMLQEPGGEVFGNLTEDFRISTVNLAEIVSKLSERGQSLQIIQRAVSPLVDNSIDLSVSQAIQAGLWRKETKRFGLSMADRCCLALGLELGATVYTTDRAWEGLDLGVRVQVVR